MRRRSVRGTRARRVTAHARSSHALGGAVPVAVAGTRVGRHAHGGVDDPPRHARVSTVVLRYRGALWPDMPPPRQLSPRVRRSLARANAGLTPSRPRYATARRRANPSQPSVKAGSFTRDYADVSFGQGAPGVRPAWWCTAADAPRESAQSWCIAAGSAAGQASTTRLPWTRPGSATLTHSSTTIRQSATSRTRCWKWLTAWVHPAVDLYGTHTGASIALETAIRGVDRIRNVVFDGLPMFSDAERADHLANYVPPFEVRWDGSHVVWAWNFIRNMTVFYPIVPPGSTRRTRPDVCPTRCYCTSESWMS